MNISEIVAWLMGISLTIAATGVSTFFQGRALKDPKKNAKNVTVTGIACIVVAIAYALIGIGWVLASGGKP